MNVGKVPNDENSLQCGLLQTTGAVFKNMLQE